MSLQSICIALPAGSTLLKNGVIGPISCFCSATVKRFWMLACNVCCGLWTLIEVKYEPGAAAKPLTCWAPALPQTNFAAYVGGVCANAEQQTRVSARTRKLRLGMGILLLKWCWPSV